MGVKVGVKTQSRKLDLERRQWRELYVLKKGEGVRVSGESVFALPLLHL